MLSPIAPLQLPASFRASQETYWQAAISPIPATRYSCLLPLAYVAPYTSTCLLLWAQPSNIQRPSSPLPSLSPGGANNNYNLRPRPLHHHLPHRRLFPHRHGHLPLETILRANRVPFKAVDVAVDDKARSLWGRRAGKDESGRVRKLPALDAGWLRPRSTITPYTDIVEIEDWNEYGELKQHVTIYYDEHTIPSIHDKLPDPPLKRPIAHAPPPSAAAANPAAAAVVAQIAGNGSGQ
ncbi:hypothetical protein NM208_g15206 [Fusarium decemcellulare]|uniref:Uncharacterized protein n=1 Tax=Fusarium decemcellulare TaxID=57161 RepID=A0ACC1RE75_9HYPO|nr:hypothetical protein NM208_g15206 [Fusarium decemcellulare]